jgi:Zn-dependent protease with chaperone function
VVGSPTVERPRPARPTRRSALGACLALAALAACAAVPYTGRRQLILMPAAQEAQLGTEAFAQLRRHDPVLPDARINTIVTRVGRRIAAIAERRDYRWEFIVFDQPKTVNAFALPGGKVGVYSGLLPIARDEAGLAVVIGHEIAHALARHGAERYSQAQLLQLGGAALAIGLGGNTATNGILQVYGLGAQVGVLLPFGRQQESEADHIGLILMAKAGYDPAAALGLWQRMEARGTGGGPPEFLSTHPSYGTRVGQIERWLPEARAHLRGRPEIGETLPSIDTAQRPAAEDRELYESIASITQLAGRRSRPLLRAMVQEFGVEAETIVGLQRELDLSAGELAVALVLADEKRLSRTALASAVRGADGWPAIVRRQGVSPATVSRRLGRLAAAAG